MAKTSMIVKEQQKEAAILKYKAKRDHLRSILKDPKIAFKEKMQAQIAMQKLPIRSCPVRLQRRCNLTGRPRAVLRRYGLSRSVFREQALQGNIPGLKKASW